MELENEGPVQQPPETLYHYTSQEGLIGIVGNKKMWATNIFYLNDSAEYIYALNLMFEVLDEYARHPVESKYWKTRLTSATARKGLALEVWKILRSVGSYMSDKEAIIPIDHIYVLSFTKEKDDLSQWRGYCPNGNGFCLGFNTAGLTAQLNKSKMKLVRCIYGRDEQKVIIRRVINKKMEELDLLAEMDSGCYKMRMIQDLSTNIFHTLTSLMPTMKDEAFANENEWRFVFRGGSPDGFRAGKSMPIPYMEMPLAGTVGGHERRGVIVEDRAKEDKIDAPLLILRGVVVGPTPHGLSAKASVELLLRKSGANFMRSVELSKIPYRTW